MARSRGDDDGVASLEVHGGAAAIAHCQAREVGQFARTVAHLGECLFVKSIAVFDRDAGDGPPHALTPHVGKELLMRRCGPIMEAEEDLCVDGVIPCADNGVDEDELARLEGNGVEGQGCRRCRRCRG